MKKVTLSLIVFCVFFASNCLRAQSTLPEVGTAEDGPWYYIQVKGSDAVRTNRVFAAIPDETTGNVRVMGVGKDEINSIEDVNRRLWSFEDYGNGSYIIVNKQEENVLGIWNWAEKSKDIAIVETTLSTGWKLIPVEGQEENGYFNMEATDPITSGSPYLHQGNDGWKFGL
ncbi:MAG: hypothetical protein LBH12_05550, partial [Dysgonamonadaceae bacterium]|nr:hypothetical protein [Dysgonamonadaceae bacterium]